MFELDFIEAIKKLNPSKAHYLGIGDDAAVFSPEGDRDWVVATDMILDQKHFKMQEHPLPLVGRKALGVNLSDLAAMGAEPRFALVSLGLPQSLSSKDVSTLWSGLQEIANKFRVNIIGGDTNTWTEGLVVSVTVLGTVPKGKSFLRSGGKPGDILFLTGPLGGSLNSGHHLSFIPRIAEALNLRSRTQVNAMIDISDGLATDLHHICKASNLGASIHSKAIPISERVPSEWCHEKRLQAALCDGEDFELLFSVPASEEKNVSQYYPNFFKIGELQEAKGVFLDERPLVVKGYEHNLTPT